MALNFHPLVKGVLQDDKNEESNEYLMTSIWRCPLKERQFEILNLLPIFYILLFL